jgi:diguanylate cyclase (GGDEF)-like protein
MRTAIMLLALVFMATIAAAVFTLAINEHRNLYQRYAESDLNALSDNMANELLPLLAQQQHFFQLKTFLLKLDPYAHTEGAAIYDPQWQLLESYYGQRQQALAQPQRISFVNWTHRDVGLFLQDGNLVAVKPIGDPSLLLGYLVIIRDLTEPLNNSTRNLSMQVGPAATASILLIMLIFYAFGNAWLRPLNHLSNMAKTVQRTKNYNIQLPVSGQFEVASLTRDLNDMLAVIRQEHEVNHQYVALLEQQSEEMSHLANYDHLTGLVNRQNFRQQLQQRLQMINEQSLALMFVDLDGFKLVNDSLGHEVGDQLLAHAAKRLQQLIQQRGLVCRHGGDEFLLLIQGYDSKDELIRLATSVIDALTQKFAVDSWEIRVSASIGIAEAGVAGMAANELIRNADIAMYEAKNAGKSRYSFFCHDMMTEHQRRLEIANYIDFALEHDEFVIAYQPKVLANGQPVGAEALIRWHSLELGFISPAEFIPIAEQAGKITQLTQWVINRVCQDLSDTLIPAGFKHSIGINLSAADLKKHHLLGSIKGAIQKHRITAQRLEFEVTEHSYLDDFSAANQFLSELSKMGIRIALDDFGTGYSSLSYLNRIPIDTLKIDKQFVDCIGQSTQDDALIITIIEMGRRLGLNLCAEGVESKEQLDFLRHNGCHMIQGYYFAKPMPLTDFCEFLQQASKKEDSASKKRFFKPLP